jgi:flagellar hook-length control protein FliK
MIGLTNEKAALPFPAPESKSTVDNLYQRKENVNRKSGPSGFENYLKAAATEKNKPVRETGSKAADQQAIDRRDRGMDNKIPDSKQAVKEDKGLQKDARDDVESKTEDNTDVSAKTPEQPVTDSPVAQSGESQNAAIAGAQAQSMNPGVQTVVEEGIQLTELIAGVQSADAVAGNDGAQLQMNLPTGALLNSQVSETPVETVAGNQQTIEAQPTATGQNAVDALMGLTQNPNSATGETSAASNQMMNEAIAALMNAETPKKDNSAPKTANQPQIKTAESTANGLKGTVVNASVLEVFQDKVTTEAATQSLVQSKDELHQSLRNAAVENSMAADAGNKPLNLAVLQTQLAVGENPDQANAVPVTPLQQQQLPGGQFQEITGTTAQTAGKDQLFTQIMDHAKLMLSGNQSEMEMSLKPDHLGKLQLRVLVENQVVTARFMAESQQVKQIIETNLNQLRDQLRENGLQVDLLSVSVGTGTGEQLFNQTAGNPNQSGNSRDSRSYTDDMSDSSIAGDTVSAPKSLQETVIDLIA